METVSYTHLELQAQYEAVELDENSTIDLEAIKAAVEQLLADAKVADAKLVATASTRPSMMYWESRPAGTL